MAHSVLLDTDVLIDLNRMRQQAVDYVLNLPARPSISAVTIVELYAGVREGRERTELDAFVTRTNVIAVEAQVAERAGLLFRQYSRSHGTGLADAIIAARALIERITLVTLNARHFPMITDILVPYTRS